MFCSVFSCMNGRTERTDDGVWHGYVNMELTGWSVEYDVGQTDTRYDLGLRRLLLYLEFVCLLCVSGF